MMNVYLSIGTNLGNRESNLRQAVKLITDHIGKPGKISHIYESEPWGFESRNSFFNCCLVLKSSMPASDLLERLLSLEQEMGRVRQGSTYSDRVIDMDLLLYGQEIIHEYELTVPHAEMTQRRFVLEPLAEIAADVLHPQNGLSIRELLERCPDSVRLQKLGKL